MKDVRSALMMMMIKMIAQAIISVIDGAYSYLPTRISETAKDI